MDIEQPDQLLHYLRTTRRLDLEEFPQIEVLTGGVSNRTVLVKRKSGPSWVLKQALERLRVKVDWFSNPDRIQREALGMTWLGRLAPPETIPTLVFEDRDNHLLCMTAVPQPHDNWKPLLLAGKIQPGHIRQFASLLGTIHRRSFEEAATLSHLFDNRSYFESLRLEPYYTYAARQIPEASSFLNALLVETRQRRHCLVHGDYSPKNILVHRDRLILLDHEVIHWGDPAFDGGFALTHLLSKAHHLPESRESFRQAVLDFCHIYKETVGEVLREENLEDRIVRHTLGCLLARVAGRSPLEYLDDTERARQRRTVVKLMQSPPATMAELADSFVADLNDSPPR